MAGRTAVHVAQQVLLIVNPLVEVPLQVFVRLWRQQHSAAELQTAAVLALLAALLAAALAALLARPRRPPARESPTDEAHAGESCEWLNAWLQARRLRVPEDQLKAQLATALARQLQPQDPQQQQQPQQAEQTPAQEAQPQPQAARRGSNFEFFLRLQELELPDSWPTVSDICPVGAGEDRALECTLSYPAQPEGQPIRLQFLSGSDRIVSATIKSFTATIRVSVTVDANPRLTLSVVEMESIDVTCSSNKALSNRRITVEIEAALSEFLQYPKSIEVPLGTGAALAPQLGPRSSTVATSPHRPSYHYPRSVSDHDAAGEAIGQPAPLILDNNGTSPQHAALSRAVLESQDAPDNSEWALPRSSLTNGAQLASSSLSMAQSARSSVISSSTADIAHGAGWSRAGGGPITLIETVHSYGTHLAVAHPAAAPESLRQWQGKTRRLHVYRGHAFVTVKLKGPARCAVTNKNLYKPLATSKAYQCLYCGTVVGKKWIGIVPMDCRHSQLPDITSQSADVARLLSDDPSIDQSNLSFTEPPAAAGMAGSELAWDDEDLRRGSLVSVGSQSSSQQGSPAEAVAGQRRGRRSLSMLFRSPRIRSEQPRTEEAGSSADKSATTDSAPSSAKRRAVSVDSGKFVHEDGHELTESIGSQSPDRRKAASVAGSSSLRTAAVTVTVPPPPPAESPEVDMAALPDVLIRQRSHGVIQEEPEAELVKSRSVSRRDGQHSDEDGDDQDGDEGEDEDEGEAFDDEDLDDDDDDLSLP